MAWLETLFPLILLLIYFLSQLGKRRGQPERVPAPDEPLMAPGPPARAEGRPTPFEELIRQIQQAAEAAEKPAPAPPPAPPPRRAAPPPARRPPRPAPPARPRLAPPADTEFRPVGAFEHDRHGFGLDSPFSEEAFEHLPRGADVTEHAPGHLFQSPHGLFERPGQPAPQRPHPLAERLRRPGNARDAFALREILGAPRARRPRR